ncbi:hypothetical protein [Dyadobacter frigoris]|uniref:Uncharacterized protein n=1 Tax=Dyadobacter frigoris TaxID=2576211 RepID=A0A4V6BIS0_9BACT|nr:hypothetical protein [Dyadobacter frigoris]TKT91183.1 hypothetical protein FDK13_16160 [Dyadobacter frigoris]GLU55115.1 hypothetical protein Dfri01_45760 [Dyadobacter frigoris]
MKLKLLIILTIASFSAFGQTRKETIDWLNSKFESSPIIRNSIQQSTRFLKIEDTGNFSVQEFLYATNVALPTSRNYNGKTLYTGNFKDLSPNSVRSSRVYGEIFIFASCTTGKCVNQQDQGPDFDVYKVSEVAIGVISDPSLEARCKKAFIHLITISGGKKEAF